MVEQAITTFALPTAADYWYGNNAWGRKDVEEVSLKSMALSMSTITPGRYAKGHTPYSDNLATVLHRLNVVTYFIYRDLRDVLVSLMFHILRASPDQTVLKHPNPLPYQRMSSHEQILVALLDGIEGFPPFIDWWEMYAPWLGCEWVCKVPYEAMIHKRYPSCMALAQHFCMVGQLAPPSKGVGKAMAKRTRQTKRSVTYRKGKVGDWTNHFTPLVQERFTAYGGDDWLRRLGYIQEECPV